ncbi:MAG: AAA family ATPase [Caldithrix sp.]|nr:MAG: AAA family ATPase [Caldithrix sp.]
MPIFSCGVRMDAKSRADCDLKIDSHFIRSVSDGISVEEMLLTRLDSCVESFIRLSDRDGFEATFVKAVQKALGLSLADVEARAYRAEGAVAVKRFLNRAMGLNEAGEVEGHIHEFRTDFLQARETGLIGPYFNRLYQRGLWLAEKARIEFNLQKKAVSPELVVSDLAQKIFGDLKGHSVFVAGNSAECEPFLQRLVARNIGEVFFLNGAGRKSVRGMCDQFHGKMVSRDGLGQMLRSVDLVLLFDQEMLDLIVEHDLSRVMSTRNNAPLLWVTLLEGGETATKQPDFSKFYNVYAYNRNDLHGIVEANLREYQKVIRIINRLVVKEIDDFFDWVNSSDEYRFGNIIGKSDAVQKILELIARISQTDISVLIDGESGTGKELVALAIHAHSGRSEKPFVTVNCGALPEGLLESELFGHVKGSFTGATSNKKGLIEEADQGTIFLDEIGETSQATQVKLLRFLQEGEIKPVGSNETRKLDVRVLAATNRDLEKMVEEGTFRQDLFYRLNVIQITVPPLRDRREDILPLTQFFVKKYSDVTHKTVYGLDEGADKKLKRYHWPGNVRELENAIERAVALSSGQVLTVEDLPPAILGAAPASNNRHPGGDLSLKDLERRHIAATLEEHDWNYDLVTRILGIGRTTLWRKMKEYNISN